MCGMSGIGTMINACYNFNWPDLCREFTQAELIPLTPLKAVLVLRRTIQKAGTALIKRQPISCPTAPGSLSPS